MSDAVTFDDTCPRFGLPLLHAGQAQKEAFVNEGFAITDALLHCSVAGEAAAPPGSPVNGENWLVASGATGEWAGRDAMLACHQAGNWIYVPPRDGMRIFDVSSGQQQHFRGIWTKATEPGEPVGGTTVDAEARAAISELIAALRAAAILPPA